MTLRLDPPPMKSMETGSVRGWEALRVLPGDLLAIVAFVLVADSVISVAVATPILRLLVGFPVLFFVPGYVLVAAMFPAEHGRGERRGWRALTAGGGLPLPTRLALSFGLSVALIPVFAVALAFSPVGFGRDSLLGLLTVFVLLGAAVGAVRRLSLPREERFRVPLRRRASDLVDFVRGPDRPLAVGVNALLVVSVVLATSGFAYAVFVPPADAAFADFMLLTRSGDGEYVSSGYPTEFTQGEGQEVVVGIASHADTPTDYSVVVELQRARGEGEDLRVVERSELTRLGVTVGPDETVYRPHDVEPDLVGEDLRLVYYFYDGEAPENPSMATADDHLHLWIDVTL